MTFQFPSSKKTGLFFAGGAIAFLLFSWLIFPRILQSQAEAFIAVKTGHHLTMSRPQFNPFELSLRLSGLHLTEPDGKPLLAFRELVADVSSASLFRGALVFDGIRLDGLEANAVLLPDGKLNWSALVNALQSPDKNPESSLPGFEIQRFTLSGTRLDFTDYRVKPAFVTRIEPADMVLTDFSSLTGNKGQYKFSARTSDGARLTLQGEARLAPLTTTGNFKVEQVNLAAASTYFKDLLPTSPPVGLIGLSANFRVGFNSGKLEVVLDQMAARLTGFGMTHSSSVLIDAVDAQGGRFDLGKNTFTLGKLRIDGSHLSVPDGPKALELGSLVVDDIGLNLASHQVTVGRIALGEGHIRAVRDAKGRINVVEAFKKLSPVAQAEKHVSGAKTVNQAKPVGWHYRLEKLALADIDAVFTDESVSPAAQLGLKDFTLEAGAISEDWNLAVPLKAAFNAQDGGRVEAGGNVVPGAPAAEIGLKLTELSLKPAQPYLSQLARLKLANGKLSTEGHVSYNKQGASFNGGFELRDLLLNEADTGNIFLAWKSLASRSLKVNQSRLDIDELVVNGIDTRLIINKDKSLSFKRILMPAAPAPDKLAGSSAQQYVVNIDRLRFAHGEMDFADYSLALPFGTRIHGLKGVVAGLSTHSGAIGQLELDGQVDEYGIARAVGQINLSNPTDFMDINVVFRNIEMAHLTPYSATFAGRKIDSGKLSLDLEYKIKQRQMQGKNKVIMNQLMLGEKVESAEAKDLPLDLAISILQDADGRIDLGLPVSGSMDDPKFSYSGIVWQAIQNILTRIATAPFRALGALFGGDDQFENITFEAGRAELTPPEREKLVRLAEVLTKRPALSISVHGVYADTDRVALQDIQLRRIVAKAGGQHLDAVDDPGPLSTYQPKVQAALEELFSEGFGGGELAAQKAGFRRANPGKLQESVTGKFMSGLSGMFREKRTLTEQEVNALKGADFYAVLFERLRSKVVVDDKQLQALGAVRGEATAAALKLAGAPADRLTVLTTEKVTAEGRDVPVKLELGTAAKAAAQ